MRVMDETTCHTTTNETTDDKNVAVDLSWAIDPLVFKLNTMWDAADSLRFQCFVCLQMVGSALATH